MRWLQIDENHPVLAEMLTAAGHTVEEDFHSDYSTLKQICKDYDGILIRSRIPLDADFLKSNPQLKAIGRVGAGLENIDLKAASALGIEVFNSPEGNRDAVAEHCMGMILVLTNRLFISSEEVKKGIWKREENRGTELKGKIFGIIGYGNMGKALAKRLSGFGCEVIFHDIKPGLTDAFATQVTLPELQEKADFVSLHLPLTEDTLHYVDDAFIQSMHKPFYLINTARGKNVCLRSVAKALENGKIKGAALDVLELEKSSFENLEAQSEILDQLLSSEKCIITPHIAGWTLESKYMLASVLAEKILKHFA